MSTTEKIGAEEPASSLFGMSPEQLRSLVVSLDEPAYRAAQLADALYRERLPALDHATTLPSSLRDALSARGYTVGLPEIVQTATSIDGTERYLIRMADGETVETVWMPGGDGAEPGLRPADSGDPEDDPRDAYKRATICVSSQVGCAVNCQFCLTAKLGMRRNLTAGEIAGQVVAVLNRHQVVVRSARGLRDRTGAPRDPDRINLVFMGMGEPFLNYDAFMAAVRLLVLEIGIPASRMTVSTSGIEPAIRRFALEPIRPNLALSLNASNDEVREAVMPITRKWKIAALLDALKTIPLGKRQYVTFEYVLLGGINDRPQHAREVLALLDGLAAKVNLIVWNSGPAMPFAEPQPADVAAFQRILRQGGLTTFIRRPRGRDIYAACGQLKRTLEDFPHSPLVEIAAALT